MFKSVFARYMIAFMAIILVSFSILTVIVGSIVKTNSDNSTEADLSRIAMSVDYLLRSEYADSSYKSIKDYIVNEAESTETLVSAITRHTRNLFVLIIDVDGKVIFADKTAPEEIDAKKSVGKLSASDHVDGFDSKGSDFGGLLSEKHYSYAIPLPDKTDPECVIFACTPISYTAGVIGSLNRMILMASMWVMIAAIIASYFISERIVRPIKSMSRAAREFAAGHFDVRVPVIGDSEISELAMAFNNMASSLATLEDTRSTFLANVSHDLRTPMTTISGYIDGILDGAIPPEKQSYYLEIVASEVRRLSRLVSSLLDISRIEAGERKFTMQPFDVCEMARQVLISFETRIDQKKLDVSFECDNDREMVIADRDAIHQILYNICDNAVKFSREGGKYILKIEDKDKKIYVSVYNEGEGIAAEDIPHIFDRFYKGDKSRGKDKTGVGLGMYITKTIIDAHKETISVNSKQGQYCEFVFTLKKAGKQAVSPSEKGKKQ